MSTTILVKNLNKEVQTLRKEVAEIRSVLLGALTIPEESIREYKNSVHIRRTLRRALENRMRA